MTCVSLGSANQQQGKRHEPGSEILLPARYDERPFRCAAECCSRTQRVHTRHRIVTTGSITGTLSWAGGSTYSGSKHWVEAITDALAGEMEPLGVSVSLVEPGNYQSYIRRSSVLRQFAKIEAAGGEITEEIKKQYEATEARKLSCKQPDEVSQAFMHALFDDKPLRRYMGVPNAEEQAMTISIKIEQLVRLNEWGPRSYSREELSELLRQAMSEDKADE